MIERSKEEYAQHGWLQTVLDTLSGARTSQALADAANQITPPKWVNEKTRERFHTIVVARLERLPD